MHGPLSSRKPITPGIPDTPLTREIAHLNRIFSGTLPVWPNHKPYGSLSFHMHVSGIVEIWRETPIIGNPTATIDRNDERAGCTVIRFESNDEQRKFVNHHNLHEAILIESFEGYGGGHIQLRNEWPESVIAGFLYSLAESAAELRKAADKCMAQVAHARKELFNYNKGGK